MSHRPGPQRGAAVHHPRRRRLAAVVLAGAMAVLAACGGDDGDIDTGLTSVAGNPGTGHGDGGAGTTAGRPAGVIPSPKGESYADGEPRRGGRAVYGLEGGFQRIDPAGVTNGILHQIMLSVFGNLMTMDENGQVIPGMAESMESDDFVTWTMKLRPGIRFTDGTPYDSAAVLAHMNRLKDPATKYAYASLLAPVVSMSAPDPLTVVFVLDGPFTAFPGTFVNQGPSFVPSPKAVAELGADFGVKPVGAGPFIATSVVPDAEVVLQRNPDYWEEGLPYLDELVLRPISDSEAKLASLQTGDIDAAFTLSDQDWERAEAAGVKVLRQRSNTYQTTLLNLERAPFDDVRVRRALAMAIDNDAVNDVVYGGVRHVMRTVLPPEHPYADPTAVPPDHDPVEAKRLIDEYVAEKGGPIEFDISVNIQPEFQQVWTIILQMWEQIGVKANMSVMDQAEHVAQANSGNYDAQGRYGSVALQPDVNAFAQFHTAGGTNVANMSDPIIDAALERLKVSGDEADRREQMEILEQQLADQSYLLYHTLQSQGFYLGSRVKGFPGAHGVSTQYFETKLMWV